MGLTWRVAGRMLVQYPGLTFLGLVGMTTGSSLPPARERRAADPRSGFIAYVSELGVMAAAAIDVVPALQATGRRVQTRLQNLSAQLVVGALLGMVAAVRLEQAADGDPSSRLLTATKL